MKQMVRYNYTRSSVLLQLSSEYRERKQPNGKLIGADLVKQMNKNMDKSVWFIELVHFLITR